MKYLIIIALVIYSTILFAQTVNKPFPQHISYTGTHIKPNNYSQTELDNHVTSFYDEWKTEYPVKNGKLVNVEPHWMRQLGTLMVNHGITKEGRTCQECHSPHGILDFEVLGYSKERIKDLTNLPELKMLSSKMK